MRLLRMLAAGAGASVLALGLFLVPASPASAATVFCTSNSYSSSTAVYNVNGGYAPYGYCQWTQAAARMWFYGQYSSWYYGSLAGPGLQSQVIKLSYASSMDLQQGRAKPGASTPGASGWRLFPSGWAGQNWSAPE